MKYGKSNVLICEIMGFVRIFWKEQRAYLPKTSISGQIVSWDISPVVLWWLHINPSKFDLGLNVSIQVKYEVTGGE